MRGRGEERKALVKGRESRTQRDKSLGTEESFFFLFFGWYIILS